MALEIPSAISSGEPVQVSEAVFGRDLNEPLIHQLVVAYMAAGRSGTKAQKSRSEVSGGGIKPWRQKGTGRARAGTTRSPLWRTGGATFAAKNRSYAQKLNKKMYRAAMRSIFSELLRQGRLVVVDVIEPVEPKTRELLNTLRGIGLEKGLVVTHTLSPNLYLAARNLPNIDVCESHNISPVALIQSDKVVLTSEAAKQIEVSLS
jgi:large subunit ribosomal protein L4